jgi:hypothetical protein
MKRGSILGFSLAPRMDTASALFLKQLHFAFASTNCCLAYCESRLRFDKLGRRCIHRPARRVDFGLEMKRGVPCVKKK